jgi:hypothetical protein
MCSSTIFLRLIQNHIVSDFDNISCSVFNFFRHFIQKCSLQAGEGKNLQTEHNAWKRQPKIETITTVIDELF